MRTQSKRAAPVEAAALPTVPGLALCRPLDAGRPGPPWRAKDVKSGYEVVLRELADTDGVPELLARLPDHPHLRVPLLHLDVTGRAVLATRYAAHRGLDQLLDRRAGLSPGEVSSIAMAVGRALAAMHASGLVHGSVAASDILIGSQGRTFLDATSMVTRLAKPGTDAADAAGPAADVAALARLLAGAVLAPVPDPMVAALAPGAVDMADELVRRLVAAVPPEPLRLTADPDLRVPRPAGRGARSVPTWVHRPSRRVAVRCGAGAVLVGLALGALWPHPDDRPQVPAPETASMAPPAVPASVTASASPSAVDWSALVADLDSRRGEAFSSGDVEGLTDVDAVGSSLLAGDLAALHQLSAAGLHASGFHEVLHSVRALSVTASEVVLRVVDERPAYQLVRASDGLAVESRPARPVAAWRVELVLAPAGWQVRSVRAA